MDKVNVKGMLGVVALTVIWPVAMIVSNAVELARTVSR